MEILCMTNTVLGDIVFVREIKDKREIEGGQSYVVITNEDRYLKMIYIEDGKLKLVSYNNAINPDGRRKSILIC